MKYFVCIIFIVMPGFTSLWAQTQAVISGQVISVETQQPIPFSLVTISTPTDSVRNGGYSKEDGFFVISGLQPGQYTLTVSCLGYKRFQKELWIGELNPHYNIGKIELQPAALALQEVEITGDRATLNAELSKKSYDMSSNIAQSGGTVMDAMKAMPGINFDQEGKVILRGSDNVIVLVDGRPSSLTGYGNQSSLDNISAANIERIEIINNPSAKYDANGMAGIINLVYKKEKEKGVHGSMGFTYGLGVLGKARLDLPTDLGSYSPTPKYIPSLDLNSKQDKWSFSLQSQALFQRHLPNNEFTTRTYADGRTFASQVPENRQQRRYIFKGGVDYALSDHQTLTVSGIYDWERHTDTAQVPYVNVLSDTRNRFIAWNEDEITGYLNFALLYEHRFQQIGHTLTSQLQYIRGWEDETYFINDSSFLRPRGREVTNVLGVEHISSLTVDYERPLLTGRIETGTKLQIRNLPVEYVQQRGENSILYSGLGNWSKWGESLYASYLNWVHEKARYEVEVGLRAEYTRVFYDMDPTNAYYQQNDAYDYFRLFPNMRFSFRLGDQHKFSLFYSNRVDRPGEPQLRMYSKSDDHELVKVGNPYLRPQFTQSFELGYKFGWESGSVYLSGYTRRIKDPYMRIYTPDTAQTQFDVIVKSYSNTGNATHQGVEVVFDQQVLEFWKLGGNFNFYQNKISAFKGELLFPYPHGFELDASVENVVETKVINTFTLGSDYQIQVSALYFAPKNIPQGRQFERSSVDVGVKKKIWAGKGELTFSFSDVFNNYGIRQEIVGEGFTAVYENFYETQVIRLGVRYKF